MTALKFSSIQLRLFLIVFTSTAVVGGCTVLLMFFIDYNNRLQDGERQINQLMDTVEYSAAIAGYGNNKEIANDVIKGLMRSDNVCQARLYNKTGLNEASSKHLATSLCTEVITHTLHSPFDDKEIVGILETRMDSPLIKERAYHQARQFALTLLALVLLPGVIIWAVVSRLITKPIHQLSKQLHYIDPGTNERIGTLTSPIANEIVQLANDVNQLLGVVENTLNEEREQRELIREMKQKYQHLAHHDMLTGLPNRSLFSDRLQQMMIQAKRSEQQGALIFFDLDSFKPVNDSLGHDIGDMLLQEVAQRVLTSVRESDSVARIGGDEFVVLLPAIEAQQDAITVAEKIRHALQLPFTIKGHTIHIGTSIGIALYPQHGEDEISLVKNADVAMYQAKQNGRNTVQVYCEGMGAVTVASA